MSSVNIPGYAFWSESILSKLKQLDIMQWVLSGVGKRLGSTRANEDMEVDTSVMALEEGRVSTFCVEEFEAKK